MSTDEGRRQAPGAPVIDRRGFCTFTISAATLAAGSAWADAPIFLGYDQEQLDRAYDQAAWAPDWAEIEGRGGPASAVVRQATPPHTESYGPSEAELLDVFAPPDAHRAPVIVFIHGGAWSRGTKDDYSYPAPTFNAAGAIYVAISYAGIDAVNLTEMVEQCRRAVAWTVANAARFGGDPDRIFVSGHSAGGHLAGCVLTTDWAGRGLASDPIRGGLLLSGLYDLYPVQLSSRGRYLKATEAEQTALSPLRHLDRITCPIAIVSADMDTPEFKRQSEVFAAALAGMGRLSGRRVLFNTNHFQEPEQLAKPDTEVSRIALAMIGA